MPSCISTQDKYRCIINRPVCCLQTTPFIELPSLNLMQEMNLNAEKGFKCYKCIFHLNLPLHTCVVRICFSLFVILHMISSSTSNLSRGQNSYSCKVPGYGQTRGRAGCRFQASPVCPKGHAESWWCCLKTFRIKAF